MDAEPQDSSNHISYAHAGRRRRSITEELFRCSLFMKIPGERIKCNALVWRTPAKMREHLSRDHGISEKTLAALDDTMLRAKFTEAHRLPQEGIPDDDEE